LGWAAARALPALTLKIPAQPWVIVTLLVAGLSFSLGGVILFRRARTTVSPLTPDAATTLVMSGFYRITRNPMYLGFLFFLLAEIAWLANPAACVIAPLFVVYLNRFQIEPEERALRHRFGQTYNSYAAHVRRWI
jgi:protein-S-isoprenylcysteine O-methyltransferase Ste14